MIKKRLNPANVSAPIGPYSQGYLVQEPGRWLHISGQIGAPVDGIVAQTFEEQAELTWENITRVLAEAEMGVEDLVKVVTYIVGTENIPLLASIRSKYLGKERPAATLIIVEALARPEWKIEIEAVAFSSND